VITGSRVPASRGLPVLVTGAGGFVGSHIVKLLTEQDRRVRALVRATSNCAALEGLPVEIVIGDALDPASLRAAMRGCATVFHCIVDARVWLSDPAPLRRNNIDGLVNAMEAALAEGVGRFVFISTIGTLGINPNGPVTEDIFFNWLDRAPPYIRVRLEAENRFLDYCRERGLPGVALCVANTYGPADHQPTPHGGLLWAVASGRVKVALDTAQPTVDIRDVAEAAVLAEVRGHVGQRYIIANEYADARAFFGLATAHTGVPMPRLLPYRVVRAIAWVAHRYARLRGRKDIRFNPDSIFLANVFKAMDSGKARRELGWEPRPLTETLRGAIEWLAAHER
jgi:dihydroflavonol-4-reductase